MNDLALRINQALREQSRTHKSIARARSLVNSRVPAPLTEALNEAHTNSARTVSTLNELREQVQQMEGGR